MNLLIVDAYEVIRRGLILTLRDKMQHTCFFEAQNLEEADKKLGEHDIDYVLLDVDLNGENGIELIEKYKKKSSCPRFIVFTGSRRNGDFRRAKELGVVGYILKESKIKDIIQGIKTIEKGGKVFSQKVIAHEDIDQREVIKETLTDREFEILREIGKGLTNSQIADKLFIAENTVKKHITSILGKLKFSNRTEVALLSAYLWRRKDD